VFDHAQIAGTEPAVEERIGVRLRVVQVAGSNSRAADDDLAGNAGRKGIANAIRIAARGAEVGVAAGLAERLAADRTTSDLQPPAATNTVPQVAAPEIGDQ
jgi:hypothetical protein